MNAVAVSRSPMQCNHCYQHGHNRLTCPNGGASENRVKRVLHCSNCGEAGHYRRTCSQPPPSDFKDETTQPCGVDDVDEIAEAHEDAALQRALYLSIIERTNKEIARLTRERDILWLRIARVQVPK